MFSFVAAISIIISLVLNFYWSYLFIILWGAIKSRSVLKEGEPILLVNDFVKEFIAEQSAEKYTGFVRGEDILVFHQRFKRVARSTKIISRVSLFMALGFIISRA